MAAILLKACSGVTSLSFHAKPNHGSQKVTCHVGTNDSSDHMEVTSTKREGAWFLCHTRENTGWVYGKEIMPVTFPTIFIVSDLPPGATVCTRSK